MTAAQGFPPDPERRPSGDGAGPGGPAFEDGDWGAKFSAIVSGISPEMHWDVTADDLDAGAADDDHHSPSDDRDLDDDEILGWYDGEPDTAEARRLRRELRRRERAEAVAAFAEAQAEFEAELAADEEHYIPPPPPPLPRLRRRTVGALLLMAAGILLLAWPTLLPANSDLTMVLALLLLLGGAAVLVAGMRRHRGEPGDGWDDGAAV